MPETRCDISDLQTDESLQVRDPSVVEVARARGQERRLAESVATMRTTLEASSKTELEPILVASVDGRLLVVDGHHRLKAYRLAGRSEAPCKVIPTSMKMAYYCSLLMNADDRAVEMTPEQYREAAWQFIMAGTRGGRAPRPAHWSTRYIQAQFRIGSNNTVSSMFRIAETVHEREWEDNWINRRTGYPFWKFARRPEGMQTVWELRDEIMDDARKAARDLGKTLERYGFDSFMAGLRILRSERFGGYAQPVDHQVLPQPNDRANYLPADHPEFEY